MFPTVGEHLTGHRSLAAKDQGAGTFQGDGIDTKGVKELMFIVDAGVALATSTNNIKFQNSDDDGVGDAYADIPGATVAEITDANDQTVYIVRVRVEGLAKRWIRPFSTVAVANAEFGITCVKSYVKYPKAANPVLALSI